MAGDYSGLMTGANAAMAFGVTSQTVSSYYGVLSNRYEARSKADELKYEAGTDALNATSAEMDAEAELRSGEREIGRVGLQYAQLIGRQRVLQGASGTVSGVGSNAEAAAGVEIAKQADIIAIDANSARAAGQARMRAVDARNRARMAGVSANNLSSMANAMSPALAAGTTLISGAGMVAGQWAAQQERSAYYRSRAQGGG